MRSAKKKIGLITGLLVVCLSTAVAFAAITGQLTINQGTANIIGNPFKMFFADNKGNAAKNISATIPEGSDAEGSTLVVTDGTVIEGLNVKFYKKGDSVTYSFKIKNAGGSTAYLSNISIGASSNKTNDASLSGLKYSITLSGNHNDEPWEFTAESVDGAEVTKEVKKDDNAGVSHLGSGFDVDTINCTLTITVDTNQEKLSVFDNLEGNLDLTLGAIQLNWSSVAPAT